MTPTPDDIARLSSGRVLVVGDVMIDHYVTGKVSRVSEEAPVPIIQVTDERWTPGGAANVAANLSALGGSAVIAGVVGEDPAAASLAALIGDMRGRVDVRLTAEPGRPTTIKTRYMGGQHQIVRVDREQARPISRTSEDAIIASVTDMIAGCGAMIISDYAKGVLNDRVLASVIAAARKAGAVVLVDPKRADWSAYRGAHYITPNRRELQLATGASCGDDADCAVAADIAIKATGAAILLTRSEKGMSLFREGAAPIHLPARAREVFDVSGAGDTVTAVVALSLAGGVPVETAMAAANLAASIVVGKRGTATTTQAELIEEIAENRHSAPATHGALPLADVKALRQQWAREGLTVGFTNGCFDILHGGHISLLRQAAAACDRLIVALNTDASVSKLKGPTRPVQKEDVRATVMASVKGVDAVVLFGEQTPLGLITALEPDVLVKGADYTEDQIVGADIVKARGGRIVRAVLVEGQSTTKIIEKSGGPT